MIQWGNTWALILAAGEGSRLQSLTTTSCGVAVPKQFCSLRGGPSLLHEAIERAASVVDRSRICTIVAQHHRQWWHRPLQSMHSSNVIVQPGNRGTANGILLPLLHIARRDPQARIVLLPSDHHVRDEYVLARALRQALSQLAHREEELLLLGVEPEELDPDLGYIVPGDPDRDEARRVLRFEEKPSAARARELLFLGALWNIFIVAARAQTLLDMFALRFPELFAAMSAAVAQDAAHPSQPEATAQLYAQLPDIDFSKHMLSGHEEQLRVLSVPPCGWSDLGTPDRVVRTLSRTSAHATRSHEAESHRAGHLILAHQIMKATPATSFVV